MLIPINLKVFYETGRMLKHQGISTHSAKYAPMRFQFLL